MEVVTVSDGVRDEQLCRLVESYERDLLRISYVYLRDLALAEDAVQETFIKVYKSLETFRGECNERTWLMRIAINTCKDMRRSSWFKYVDRKVSLDNIPQAYYIFTETDDELTTEIMRLPRKHMEVILLYYYQGMTIYEIAQVLGITAPGVSGRLKRAYQQLRIKLEGEHIYG